MNQVIASKRNRERTTALARVQAALRRLDEAPEDFWSVRRVRRSHRQAA